MNTKTGNLIPKIFRLFAALVILGVYFAGIQTGVCPDLLGMDLTVNAAAFNAYNLTAPSLPNTTVSFSSGGTPIVTAPEGSTIEMTITPNAGYRLADLTASSFQVTGGTKYLLSGNVLTITDVSGDVSVSYTADASSVAVIEEYYLTRDINTVTFENENITVDTITWTQKSQITVDDTIPYGDTVTISVYASGYAISGTPTILINGGGIQLEGTLNSNNTITFPMPDIGSHNDSIELIEINNLTTTLKSYDIYYNSSAMRIYSMVPAPVNGAVNLTGLPLDTDGTLTMKGSTGYYAEIISPAVGATYDVTPKLFGCNSPNGDWGFIVAQPFISVIRDSDNKVLGMYFAATPAEMGNTLSGFSMNIRFLNLILPTYPITYNGNGNTGGTLPSTDNTRHEHDVFTLPGNPGNLIKTGYKFAGWSTTAGGTVITSYTMGAGPVTFYAVWAPLPTYAVNYNGNGNTSGTVPVDSNTYAQDTSVTIAGNPGNLTKTGYKFAGWSTTANGTGITSYKMGTSPVVFYALWTLDSSITVAGTSDTPVVTRTSDTPIAAGIPYMPGRTPVLSGRSRYIPSFSSPEPFPANISEGTIMKQLENAGTGDTVVINMNGTTILRAEWLDKIAGKDVTISLDMGNGLIWTINGMSITGTNFKDFDLAVSTETQTVPLKLLSSFSKSSKIQEFSVTHSGEFGFTATLSLNLGKEYRDFYANLFYYNKEKEKLEFMEAIKISKSGLAQLELTHTSSYAIVIDSENLAPGDASKDSTTTGDTVSESKSIAQNDTGTDTTVDSTGNTEASLASTTGASGEKSLASAHNSTVRNIVIALVALVVLTLGFLAAGIRKCKSIK